MIERACEISDHGDHQGQPFAIEESGLIKHDNGPDGHGILADSVDEFAGKAVRKYQQRCESLIE